MNASIHGVVLSLMVGGTFPTTGSGAIKDEVREVGSFTGVKVGSGIRATVTIGPKTSVTLSGEDNLLPLIKIEVVDGNLTTRIDRGMGIHTSKPIRLTVVTPQLVLAVASGGASIKGDATPGPTFEAGASGGGTVTVKGVKSKAVALEASGGGRVTLEGVQAEAIRVSASGGGTVAFSGSNKELDANLSGGAVLKAQDVAVQSLRVNGSGGSRAYAQATSQVTGTLSGGSTLHLKGHPSKQDVQTSGGSRINYD